MTSTVIGLDEVSKFRVIKTLYPLIEPSPFFASKAFKGKAVLVTGASRGIGLTIATFYARAGANLVLVSRKLETLADSKSSILKEVPGARIELVEADVAHPSAGAAAVKRAVDVFGRLDVLASNAGVPSGGTGLIADKDPLRWWYTQEVNTRGAFGFIHAALPELVKTKGQIIFTSSGMAHLRYPGRSDFIISNHTVNRLIELVALEYPDIKAYAVHPGVIDTPLSQEVDPPTTRTDPPELMAATALWLTARSAEFLSGRYIQANWDLNEVLAKKDEIVRDNLLVTKLATPRQE